MAQYRDSFEGFSKLNRAERLQKLMESGVLDPSESALLNESVASDLVEIADQCIENVVGCFPIPLGIAMHFNIDQRDCLIPMAVEETSIVAALSKMAKWIRHQGSISTGIKGCEIIGQIHFPSLNNSLHFKQELEKHQNHLIHEVNHHVLANLVKRGGGVTRLQVREIDRPDGGSMGIVHVLLNPGDAMGANLITQACEYLKHPLALLTEEQPGMCIISNLTDTKLAWARVIIDDIDPALGQEITEASLFAECDPYRAATHNKGVMNGIDPVLIATGNDWCAVESAVHAYACRNGSYQPISYWRMEANRLVGYLEAPLAVGIVGGVTRVHPLARLCLKILGIQTSDELSRILAAVGLVQNLGALRALVSEGIVAGHMKLHINNLLLAAGATTQEWQPAKHALQNFLEQHKKITTTDAIEILQTLRTRSHCDSIALSD